MDKVRNNRHRHHPRNGNTSTITSFHPPWRRLHNQIWQTYGGLLSCSLVLIETFSLPLNLDLLAFLAPLDLLCPSAFRTINLFFSFTNCLVSRYPFTCWNSLLPLQPVTALALFMHQGRKKNDVWKYRDSEQAFANLQITISKQPENIQNVLKLNKEVGRSKSPNVTQDIF